MTGKIGSIALIAGLIIAVLGGFGINEPWFGWVLAALGVVVGLLNVTDAETRRFLIASLALIVSAGSVGDLPHVGGTIDAVMNNVVTFMAPAMLVVALKSLFSTVRS